MEVQLNEKSELILDYILNVPSVFNYEEVIAFVNMLTPLDYDDIKNEWESLYNSEVVVKANNQHLISPTYLDHIKNILSDSLVSKSISAEDLGNNINLQITIFRLG